MADIPSSTISDLLEFLKVQKVVCVDDCYGGDRNAETVVAYSKMNGKLGAMRAWTTGFHWDLNADPDIAVLEIEAYAFDPARASEVAALVPRIDTAMLKDNTGPLYEAAVDRIAESTLSTIFAGTDFLPLSLEDWQKQEAAILGELVNKRILFLFDEKLDERGTSGTEFLKSIASSDPNSNAILGLLSHGIGVEDEHEETRALSDQGIRATAITKKQLNETHGIHHLKLRIRSAVLYSESHGLRSLCKTEILTSVNRALDEIDKLSPPEFEEVIFRSSFNEGIHEMDTILRIYTNSIVTQVREALRGKPEALNDIDKLRVYRGTDEEGSPGSTAWRIQRQEYYQGGEFINHCLMPLESGDIFEITTVDKKVKKFVVIGQPCDLMIRSQHNPGNRNLESVLICPITLSKKMPDEKNSFNLDLFDASNGNDCKVKFKDAFTFECWKLDLCCLNTDGRAAIDVECAPPTHLSEGWRVRFENELKPRANAIISLHSEWDKLSEAIRKNPKITAPYASLPTDNEVEVHGTKVKMGIHRTERLSPVLAAELLIAYGQYVSRPARQHELYVPSFG